MKAPEKAITPEQLKELLKKGEGKTLELKRSTAEIQGAMQTICAFLNTSGGTVIIGAGPDGRLVGQIISDATQQKIAAAIDRFEPPATINMEIINVDKDKQVIVLKAEKGNDSIPFTFGGRSYERVGSTTRKMPQSRYEQLLLERGHSKHRWENLPVEGLTIKDLDRNEIFRTRELAIQQNRISPGTSRDIGDILDRLGLRVDGKITHAALVLYGKKFLPDYPQCLIKMGRFRGTEITGEIVDNRQEHMNAFSMVREGIAFLERTMPLGARFPEGKIFREDRYPIPVDALREILLNAVMHRDYSHYSGYVAIVVFDDRIEIRSFGRLPNGITVEQLSGRHDSKPTNPLIAEAFHRTGAVEVWGRGTNRVISMCKKHGVAPPSFEERQDFLIVTFKTSIDESVKEILKPSATGSKPIQSATQSNDPVHRLLIILQSGDLSSGQLREALNIKHRPTFRQNYLHPALKAGWIEHTIPDKPNSRLQKYRLTDKGKRYIAIPGEKG